MNDYDIPPINSVSASVSIPVVACGGAGTVEDFCRAGFLMAELLG